ncbi:MAG TPA: PKD domain-containing protein [Bacteroidia bacterium]|nr:PKD domain-containing protein [Bacteroidia bacterium]
MKKKLIPAAFSLIMLAGISNAQICDPLTPVFTVNLTGNPAGTWTSPSVVRDGYCCSASGSDVCIEFILTLDSMSTGINFEITSGAIPPGSLYYQVNCGPMIPVGQPICLYGPGPHLLTFCKPGNNSNEFTITSIPEPHLNIIVSGIASALCPATIATEGLIETSITWTSIPPNGQYNSFLNCTTGCDTVTVTPWGTLPAYVDYLICGNPYPDCIVATLCDTVRIYFMNDVAVNITPQNIILCFGGANTATVTANPSGGIQPYNYVWSNGQTTQGVTVGAGTYSVSLTDSIGCSTATATVTVTALGPIVANAGNDVTVCANNPVVTLNGNIQTATGGQWLGGTGTFNPNNLTLNATYTPSSSEISNGFVNLVLQTTGTQGCPPDYDTVRITIGPVPVPAVSGSVVVCSGATTNYSILPPLTPGSTYDWTITGGTINGSTTSASVNVTWNGSGTGTITLTETNSYGCTGSASVTVSFITLPNPVITGNNATCQFNHETYVVNAGTSNTYQWSVTGGIINGSANSYTLDVTWNTVGQYKVYITETNPSGCVQTDTFDVMVMIRPVPAITGSGTGCISSSTYNYSSPLLANTTYSWGVNGGTVVAVNGANVISVQWNSTGINSVMLQVINTVTGCDSTVTLPVNVEGLTAPVIQPSTASGCQPLTVFFSGNTPAAGQTYAWTFGDALYSSSSNPTHVYNTPGTLTVTVITHNSTGCADTATAVINVYESPDASFTHNFLGQTYFVDESTLNLNNTTTGGSSYLWTFGTGDTANAFEPPYTYHTPGNYVIRLIAFNSTGCTDAAQYPLDVRVRESFFVPNAFTPNGNDVNDYFSIPEENLLSLKIKIFNRWGEIIYTSEDKNFKWDGTYNGSPAQQGIYGYLLTTKNTNGNESTQKGTITLVK